MKLANLEIGMNPHDLSSATCLKDCTVCTIILQCVQCVQLLKAVHFSAILGKSGRAHYLALHQVVVTYPHV